MRLPLAFALATTSLLVACSDSSTEPTQGGGGTTSSSTDGGHTAAGAGGSGAGNPTAGGGGESSTGGATTGGGGQGQGGGATGCLTDVSPGHHEVDCDGGITYDVEIPSTCPPEGCGLIVDIHGYTMTGDSEDDNTQMRTLGPMNGYAVVQPTAPGDNLGLPSWDQATHAPLVFAFASDLASTISADPKRRHVMGFSQGGGMTFRLLCDHADFFASGAPIGALHGCDFSGGDTPSEEVDILHVHGHVDAIVNFDDVAIPQRDAALAAWSFGAPQPIEGDPMHTATRWTTGNGTDYEFWEHDYQTSATVVFVQLKGHCVPGGLDFDGTPAGYSCEDTNTFVFGELAMQFFLDHPKN